MKVSAEHIRKWNKFFSMEGITIDIEKKRIDLGKPLHTFDNITQERIKELKKKNKFKVYEQLLLF